MTREQEEDYRTHISHNHHGDSYRQDALLCIILFDVKYKGLATAWREGSELKVLIV